MESSTILKLVVGGAVAYGAWKVYEHFEGQAEKVEDLGARLKRAEASGAETGALAATANARSVAVATALVTLPQFEAARKTATMQVASDAVLAAYLQPARA